MPAPPGSAGPVEDEPAWLQRARQHVIQQLGLQVERALAADGVPPVPITRAGAARAAAISESHFSTKFSLTTGITFRRYVTVMRVERGAELLRSTAMPIGRVAEAVGFVETSSLHRAFKTHAGQTPAEYRNRADPGDSTRPGRE